MYVQNVCMYIDIFLLFLSNDGMVIRAGNRAFMSNNNITLSNAVQENLWNLEVRKCPNYALVFCMYVCMYVCILRLCVWRDIY